MVQGMKTACKEILMIFFFFFSLLLIQLIMSMLLPYPALPGWLADWNPVSEESIVLLLNSPRILPSIATLIQHFTLYNVQTPHTLYTIDIRHCTFETLHYTLCEASLGSNHIDSFPTTSFCCLNGAERCGINGLSVDDFLF